MTDAEIQRTADEMMAFAKMAGERMRKARNADPNERRGPNIDHLVRAMLVTALRRQFGWCEPLRRT